MKRPSSTKSQRKLVGAWLKRLRTEAGLTQLELADRLGVKHCGFISQVENGFSRVPHDKIEAWARSLGVHPSHFAKHLICFYEPELHRVLYEVK